MPAIDQREPQVIRAFEKAGWVVVRQPYDIRIRLKQRVYADLALKNADQQIIIIEVKCFPDNRPWLDHLYHAVGQYMMYSLALEARGITHPLWLTVPAHIYEFMLQIPVVQTLIHHAKIKLVIVDIEAEEITQWLD